MLYVQIAGITLLINIPFGEQVWEYEEFPCVTIWTDLIIACDQYFSLIDAYYEAEIKLTLLVCLGLRTSLSNTTTHKLTKYSKIPIICVKLNQP